MIRMIRKTRVRKIRVMLKHVLIIQKIGQRLNLFMMKPIVVLKCSSIG